jgi:peptidyl-prolyl cis-trans isomerase B (cyclophilin B)
MRVHRVEPEFVVQFGDPYSRDLDRKSMWGRGGSGRVIGAAEISPKYTHEVGAVGLAYAAHPSQADSQLYIILADTERSRKLDGEYAVIGKVRTGMEVVQTIELLDIVERVTVR